MDAVSTPDSHGMASADGVDTESAKAGDSPVLAPPEGSVVAGTPPPATSTKKGNWSGTAALIGLGMVWFGVKMILKSTAAYLVTACSLFLFYGICFRPYAVRPHIDTAALAAFDLAPGNDTLRYDLALDVALWNDHRIWNIRYDHFSARLYFDGTKISPPDDSFPKFKSRTRRHRLVHPLLRGRSSHVTAAMAEEFSMQRAQGWFEVEVRLRAALVYVIWPTWYTYYYEFHCWLHFPSNATAMPAVVGDVKCSKGKKFGFS